MYLRNSSADFKTKEQHRKAVTESKGWFCGPKEVYRKKKTANISILYSESLSLRSVEL
jgi:hypothetical protein